MDHVHAISERAVDSSQYVAVLLGEPDPNQRHIGILHRALGTEPELLHLAWHCKLRNSAVPEYMTLWVAPGFASERLRNLAAFCRRVWKKNSAGGLPYAFSSPRESFDPVTGGFLFGPTRFGLTCATFVLAVFDAAGLHLADYSSWPTDRSGDLEWQEMIVMLLEKQQANQEHIDHLRSEIGSVRFRPEEVAAATALAPPTAAYQAASGLADQIIEKLRKMSTHGEESDPLAGSEPS